MKVLICNYTNDKRGQERVTHRNANPGANANETYAQMMQRSEAVMDVCAAKGLPGGRQIQDCYDILVNGVAASWSDPVSRAANVEVMLVRLRKPQLRPATGATAPAAAASSSASASATRGGGSSSAAGSRSNSFSNSRDGSPAGRPTRGGFGGFGEVSSPPPSTRTTSFVPFSGKGNRLDGGTPSPVSGAVGAPASGAARGAGTSPSAVRPASSAAAAGGSPSFHMPNATFHGTNVLGGGSGNTYNYSGSSASYHGAAAAAAPAGASVRLGKTGGFFTADGELVADAQPQQQFDTPTPWTQASDANRMSLEDKMHLQQQGDPNVDADYGITEAILGTRDQKLSALHCRSIVNHMDAVGKVVYTSDKLGSPCSGTFFMVSPNLLLTNNHVLSSETEAESATAIFFYETDNPVIRERIKTFKLDPERFFKTNAKLDYTLVYVDFVGTAVSSVSAVAAAGGAAPFKPFVLPLYGDRALRDGFLDRPMFVIQYPGGRPKEVAHCIGDMTMNAAGDRVKYQMDTEKGSSGSPVLNSILNVIALHHQSVPVYGGVGGQQIKLKSGAWVSKAHAANKPASEIQYEANQGIPITAIVADLIASAGGFLAEHPEQYRYLYELLMQDPLVNGQIPPPPPPPPSPPAETDAGADASSFGGESRIKTETAPMED